MPYDLPLHRVLRKAGWRVKIHDFERLEPPHVTILRGTREWRIGLRDGAFLIPPGGSWREIDEEVRKAIEDNWTELQEVWDQKYPSNLVSSEEAVDDDSNN